MCPHLLRDVLSRTETRARARTTDARLRYAVSYGEAKEKLSINELKGQRNDSRDKMDGVSIARVHELRLKHLLVVGTNLDADLLPSGNAERIVNTTENVRESMARSE